MKTCRVCNKRKVNSSFPDPNNKRTLPENIGCCRECRQQRTFAKNPEYYKNRHKNAVKRIYTKPKKEVEIIDDGDYIERMNEYFESVINRKCEFYGIEQQNKG